MYRIHERKTEYGLRFVAQIIQLQWNDFGWKDIGPDRETKYKAQQDIDEYKRKHDSR